MKSLVGRITEPTRMPFDVFRDERGYNAALTEHDSGYLGINATWSRQGTIRGLHYQKKNPQAKLVSCISGVIQDAAICLKTGDLYQFGLVPGDSVYIPKGYAHGFASISDSVVLYRVDAPYDPDDQHGIHYDSGPMRSIWNVKHSIVSERDHKLPGWNTIKEGK